MDLWQTRGERKRSHAQMSHQSTASPSPSPVHQYVERIDSSPPPQRRRISHPYNQPPSPRRIENMSRSFSGRPQLLHQASRTQVVDLTDEPDDVPTPVPRPRPRIMAPPDLRRSDGPGPTVIDLTDDNDAAEEADIQITHSRQIPRRRVIQTAYRGPPPREDSVDSLFMPRRDRDSPHPLFHPRHRIPPMRLPEGMPDDGGDGGINNGDGGRPGAIGGRFVDFLANYDWGILVGRRGQVPAVQVPQAMPGNLDYDQHAFAAPKHVHHAPPPAAEGFTRSPTENDTIICPSCEEELVHDKLEEQPIMKKGKKEPTRKEREEHPFWVVKECGHVFCNKCYQNRIPTKTQTHQASFRTAPGKKSTPVFVCAVEDCPSEVRSKDKWVGVFL